MTPQPGTTPLTVYVAVTHDNRYIGVYATHERAVRAAKALGPGSAVFAEEVSE